VKQISSDQITCKDLKCTGLGKNVLMELNLLIEIWM